MGYRIDTIAFHPTEIAFRRYPPSPPPPPHRGFSSGHRAEKLMLLNNRPVAESVLVSMIEECEERFSEEQRGELLDITASLPEPPFEDQGGDEEEGAAAEVAGDNADDQWEEGDNAEYDDDDDVAADDFVNEKDAVNSDREDD